jgi:hypothetical protein
MAGGCLTDTDMITMVGDREGDIYHLLARRPANVHLLVRSAPPRTLVVLHPSDRAKGVSFCSALLCLFFASQLVRLRSGGSGV